ncbi:cell attachment protein [Meliandou mastomys virus]|uniref:Cell attachment protein n=1 Tax=Meliandou mastomys virus TaxID=2940987 RepID=A0AAE9HR98_9MONO|nr:cell attachment protein [Meliandou mastomys virus]
MIPVNPTHLNMSTFYGTSPQITTTHGQEKGQTSTCQTILTMTSMIVGLLSLFTIIALNVTNITYLIGSGGTMKDIQDSQEEIIGSVKDMSGTILEEVKPKIDLINNVVSYSIPSQLTALQHILKNEVLKQCIPTFMFNDTACPVTENPKHSTYFKEINLHSISSCAGQGKFIQLVTPVEFTDYPSFIPGATKKNGCIRIPSFSLSSTIFSYCHNIIHRGCADDGISDQYFSIGRIADHGTDIPVIETITEWYLNDGLNRKSCSVASGEFDAIMACTIVTESEREDYNHAGIGKISISYMDVFGRKKEWILAEREIQFDYPYAAMYFSVGSGVIIDNQVYFLIYGGLMNPISGNAQCHAPGCNNPNQADCNNSQRPTWFYRRQVVNGIFRFTYSFDTRPGAVVKTLSPSNVWFGAEGRLMYFPYSNRTYIYIRSSSWHALPQTGIIEMSGDFPIRWVDQLAISRPGGDPCQASNRCPKECITGVYTDLFPLGSEYEHSVGVYLSSQKQRKNPIMVLINTTSIIFGLHVTTNQQLASYTTTTCFVFKMKLWCVSIVELSPGTVGEFVPVPFLYQLNLACTDQQTGITGDFGVDDARISVGAFDKPRTECYLVFNEGEIYFSVKIFGKNQAYRLNWKPGVISNTTVEGINELCHEVLLHVPERDTDEIRDVVITTEHVTLTPVTLSGGVRMPVPSTLNPNPSVAPTNNSLLQGTTPKKASAQTELLPQQKSSTMVNRGTGSTQLSRSIPYDPDFELQEQYYNSSNSSAVHNNNQSNQYLGSVFNVSENVGKSYLSPGFMDRLDTSWARKYKAWINDTVAKAWGMFGYE